MIDPIDLLWASFDTPEPVYSAELLSRFPKKEIEELKRLELLVRAANASHIACPSCDAGHTEEVLLSTMPDGTQHYSIYCPESLCVKIAPESLLQWKPNYKMLTRKIKELLGIDGRVRYPIDDRLFRLGKTKWKNKARECYLARGLAWGDGSTLLRHCAVNNRPILMIGLVPPPLEVIKDYSVTLLPLPSVVHMSEGAIQLDRELLIQRLVECDQIVVTENGLDYGELRQWVAQCVDSCMREGPLSSLIAAGVAQGQSTREIEIDLQSRGMGLDHSNVARRIIETKKHGDLLARAGNSSSVLISDVSQPRDIHGKPIPNAQPEKEE